MADFTKNYNHKNVVKLATEAGLVTFAEYAKFALQHYYNNADEFVGIKNSNAGRYHWRRRMDCITLVLRCLDVAFRGTNNMASRSKIWTFDATGALIQKYLVDHQNWSGVYYLQDKDTPPQGRGNAFSRCNYYGVDAKYLFSDYQSSLAETHPLISETDNANGVRSLAALRKVGFGFGISYSGDHTWLLSDGMIYESHWAAAGTSANGPQGLFEKRTIRSFTTRWRDGMIVVPNLEAVKLSTLPEMSCAS